MGCAMSREITPGGYWSHTLSSTMKRCDRQLYYGVYWPVRTCTTTSSKTPSNAAGSA
jgi:hypothetical protein